MSTHNHPHFSEQDNPSTQVQQDITRISAYLELILDQCRDTDDEASEVVYSDIKRTLDRAHICILEKDEQIAALIQDETETPVTDEDGLDMGVVAYYQQHGRFHPKHIDGDHVLLDEDLIYARGIQNEDSDTEYHYIPAGTRVTAVMTRAEMHRKYGQPLPTDHERNATRPA